MDSIVQYLIYSLKKRRNLQDNRFQHKESYILRLITLVYLTDKTLIASDLIRNRNSRSQLSIQIYIAKLVLKEFAKRKINA